MNNFMDNFYGDKSWKDFINDQSLKNNMHAIFFFGGAVAPFVTLFECFRVVADAQSLHEHTSPVCFHSISCSLQRARLVLCYL